MSPFLRLFLFLFFSFCCCAVGRTALAAGCDDLLALTSAAAGASILLNGEAVLDCGRGVNVAAFSSNDPGQLLDAGVFDTYGDPTAADQLLAFISGLSDGSIVAIVVEDEASAQLLEPQRTQIADLLGSTQIQTIGFRSTYAFVGFKGSGSAPMQESVDADTIMLEQCMTDDGSVSPPTPAPAPPPTIMKFEMAFEVLQLAGSCTSECRQLFSTAIISFMSDSSPNNLTAGILQIVPVASSVNEFTIRCVVIVHPTELGFSSPGKAYSTFINTLTPAVDNGAMQTKLRELASDRPIPSMTELEVVQESFRSTPYEMISDDPSKGSPSNKNSDGNNQETLSSGAIAGIVVGVLFAVGLVGVMVYRHQQHEQEQQKPFIASLQPGMTYGDSHLNSKPKDWQSKLNSWFERNSEATV